MSHFDQDFIRCDIEQEVLCFSEFKTNFSPYVPAYKGIPLAAGTTTDRREKGCNLPYCYNRKEVKGHDEDGSTVDGRSEKMRFFRYN